MTLQGFIFSEKRRVRVWRHLLFWILWGLYFGVLNAWFPLLKPSTGYISNLPYTIGASFLHLLPQAIMAYAILYLVVPLFVKKNRPLLASLCFICSWVIGSILNVILLPNISTILGLLLPASYLRERPELPNDVGIFTKLVAAFKGNFTAAGFILVIRFVKQWYLKVQRNLQLQKENTESQLQLLTAQVHPRFLFNTLNSIYSKTQNESPQGSKMIKELSDLLRYILNEGSKPLVPLNKELAMIQEYINLEKIRYGNQLALHISLPSNTGNLQIAPLMILPFVENSFKHGASRFLKSPWINLKIEVNRKIMVMQLMNGKDPELQKTESATGLGINNVRKRLELLYTNNYELKIMDEPNVYMTELKIDLTESKQKTITKNKQLELATV